MLIARIVIIAVSINNETNNDNNDNNDSNEH